MTGYKITRYLVLLLVVLIASTYFWLLASGLEYGQHWDEDKLYNSVRRVADNGIILPSWYNYPSFSFLLTFIATCLHFLSDTIQAILVDSDAVTRSDLIEQIRKGQNGVVRSVRLAFSLYSSLAIVLLFLAMRRQVDETAAFFSAVILVSSFHFFFHSRWVAPDALQVTNFCALMLSVALYFEKKTITRLLLVSCISGIIVATKYPAGLFILTPIILSWHLKRKMQGVTISIAAAFLVFVFITPGAFIDPVRFFRDVYFEIVHYNYLGHSVYTVDSMVSHFSGMLGYLTFILPHQNFAISAFLSAFAALGAIKLAKTSSSFFLSLFIPALIYFIYFSTQNVMIVRNYLILWPLLCGFSAIGVSVLIDLLRLGSLGKVAGYALVSLGAIYAFISFARVNDSLYVTIDRGEIEEYLLSMSESGYHIAISSGVADLLSQDFDSGHDPVVPQLDMKSVDGIVFMLSEFRGRRDDYLSSPVYGYRILANRAGLYSVVSGPHDVDLDYYPSWSGHDRVIFGPSETALVLEGNVWPWLTRNPDELRSPRRAE